MITDRGRQRVVLMASSEGGMEIEEVAAKTPDKIHKLWIDPVAGIDRQAARGIAQKIGIPEKSLDAAAQLMADLYRLYQETDASLVEINPLIVTGDGGIMALDGKMNFDDNALFRQPEILALRDPDEEDPIEIQASAHDLSYISLDGNIGCMVNGAGLAMATMDIIKLYGGSPANFLDVGGGATQEKVAAAFSLMLSNSDLRAILINIFGGIMRCDIIAEGVTAAAREMNICVPLVVRLEGTNVEQGKKILADSGLKIIAADSMDDGGGKSGGGGGRMMDLQKIKDALAVNRDKIYRTMINVARRQNTISYSGLFGELRVGHERYFAPQRGRPIFIRNRRRRTQRQTADIDGGCYGRTDQHAGRRFF